MFIIGKLFRLIIVAISPQMDTNKHKFKIKVD